MKKLLSIVIVITMISTLIAGTVTTNAVIESTELELGAEFAPADINNAIEMRGFTASPDGKYVYGGFLQGGRYVVRFNVSDNSQAGSYKPESSDNELYCKGLAADDRGYLYVGITHNGQGDITVAAVDKDMKEVGKLVEDLGSKTGINGVAVQKIGEKYYLYAVTAYNVDGVRRYDVTDPTKITLDTSFANNGVMDYSALTGGAGDPSYIAVDTDGYIYLTYLKTGSGKGSHVGKISADGKSLVKEAEVTQAYGICEAGDYVFAASYNKADSCVKVLKKADLSEVATLKYAAQANNLSDVAFGGNTLFVGDHGNNTTVGGAYYTAAIEPEETLPETPEEIVNAVYALDKGATLAGGSYTLTGKVTSIVEKWTKDYGNVSFMMKIAGLEDKPIEAFRVVGDEAENVKVGDTVTVTGELTHYYNSGKDQSIYEFKKNSTIDWLYPVTDISYDRLVYDGTFAVPEGGVDKIVVNPDYRKDIDFIKGKVSTVSIRGWVRLSEDVGDIDGFAYSIDDGAIVKGDFVEDRYQELANAGFPGAQGFTINIPVKDLAEGEHTISTYVINAEGDEIKMLKNRSGKTEFKFNPIGVTFTVLPEDTELPPTNYFDGFGDDHVDSDWLTNGKVANGILTLGLPRSEGWIASGYMAYLTSKKINWADRLEIKFKAAILKEGTCYAGFAMRAANGGNHMNGGRWGKPDATETADGIAIDLNVAGADYYVGVTFSHGAQGSAPCTYFGGGVNVAETHEYKVLDMRNRIEFYIDNAILFAIDLSELSDGIYHHAKVTYKDGSVSFDNAVEVNETGYIGFYQRDMAISVDDVSVKTIVDPYAPGAIGEEAQKFTVSGAEVGFEMDGDVLVVNTTAGATDPWFSISLPQIDTTVYPSFTVKYRVSSLHGNNVYLMDTEKNKGYSPESGTWTAPGLNADGQWQEKTYTIESAFPTMAGTKLTGVRFPGATAGNKFELASITFNTADVKPDPSLGLMSFDAVVIDGVEHDMVNAETGQHLGNAGQWIKENPISFNEGEVKTISARGWAQAVDGTVDAFGYKIDDGELVSGAQYIQNRPDLAVAGIQNASGFNGFNVDVSALKAGDHKITIFMISGETEIKMFDVPFTVTAAVPELNGDVNGDGQLTNADVVTLFRAVSGGLGEGEAYVEANADFNGDGTIDNRDVVALFRHVSNG